MQQLVLYGHETASWNSEYNIINVSCVKRYFNILILIVLLKYPDSIKYVNVYMYFKSGICFALF